MDQRDDILLEATDLTTNNQTLVAVLQRASDFGITLNQDKCQF